MALTSVEDGRWQLRIRKLVHDPTEEAYAQTEQLND